MDYLVGVKGNSEAKEAEMMNSGSAVTGTISLKTHRCFRYFSFTMREEPYIKKKFCQTLVG